MGPEGALVAVAETATPTRVRLADYVEFHEFKPVPRGQVLEVQDERPCETEAAYLRPPSPTVENGPQVGPVLMVFGVGLRMWARSTSETPE